MVWRISKKNEVSQKDTQQTAIIGVVIIIGLSILAWAIQHIQIV
jgi:hypothetical protein